MREPDPNAVAGVLDAQSDPGSWLALITGGMALIIVLSGTPWRWARTAITIVHEAGHAVLVGRRLQGIRLHSDTSGVTISRGKSEGPGMVLTALGGYSAPSVLGLVFAGLLAASRVTALLVLAAVLLLAVLVMMRNA